MLEYIGENGDSVLPESRTPMSKDGAREKPEIPDWVIAVLIMIAVLKRRKTQSAQHRCLSEHQEEILQWTGTDRFPARSTDFGRYRRAHQLYECAIDLQGQKAVRDGLADPK